MEIYSSIKDRLNSQHLTVKGLVKTLDKETIDKKPDPGKWSIRENIAHIVGYHQVFLARMNKISAGNNPYFDRYSADNDPDFRKWQQMNTRELLIHLEENRNEVNVYVLKLESDDLKKQGTHQKFGTMNVVEWLEFFLLHEAHHIYTIFKLLRTK
jgi:uncharacterized damage-inducible protein DinB